MLYIESSEKPILPFFKLLFSTMIYMIIVKYVIKILNLLKKIEM